MPDTRNVHSPYPRGQGLTSVPVLFSLPNVQPVIAAASMVAVGESTAEIENSASPNTGTNSLPTTQAGPQATRPPDANPIAVKLPSAEIGNDAAAKVPSGSGRLFSAGFMSQLTNVTIIVLLLAVCILGARNYMGTQTTSKEITSSRTELAIDPVVEMPTAPKVRSVSLPSAPVGPSASESASSRTHVHDASHRQTPEPNASEPLASNEPAPLAAPVPSATPVPSAATAPSNPAIPLLLPKTPPQGNASPESDASPATARTVTPTVPGAIDTETPTLNTRDIILMRSGQRRPLPNSSTDPSLPKMESVPKIESLSRSSESRSTESRSTEGKGSTTVMAGQTYPPVAPQFEPISMNPGALGSGSSGPIAAPQDTSPTMRNRYQPVGNPVVQPNQRITQPASATLPPASPPTSTIPPAKPYTPISPALLNPNGSGNLESPSTPNNLP